MNSARTRYRLARPVDLRAVQALLRQNRLPWTDVRPHLAHFIVARRPGRLLGAGGLEICGRSGLLRSLVVRAACRAEGLGTALHDRLLFYARLRGIERVYLLTTTAERFFRRLGWEPIARTAVPTGVRRTREFRELCPQTAVCLTRSLFEE